MLGRQFKGGSGYECLITPNFKRQSAGERRMAGALDLEADYSPQVGLRFVVGLLRAVYAAVSDLMTDSLTL